MIAKNKAFKLSKLLYNFQNFIKTQYILNKIFKVRSIFNKFFSKFKYISYLFKMINCKLLQINFKLKKLIKKFNEN